MDLSDLSECPNFCLSILDVGITVTILCYTQFMVSGMWIFAEVLFSVITSK